MGEMGFGNKNARAHRGIEFARAEESAVAQFAANPRPFEGFQSHAIGTGQPC